MPVLAEIEQPLRGLPELVRLAPPQPVSQFQVPLDVRLAGVPGRPVVVGGQQDPAAGRVGRVQRAQVHAAVPAAQQREGERPAGQRLQVGVWEQPGHQRGVQAEGGRVAVGGGESLRRVEHRVQRLGDRLPAHAAAPARPSRPGGKHVRDGLLLGGRQHDLARQPVEQERVRLHRAHPQRAAEVPVAAVADDMIGAAAGRPPVGQVLGLVGGEELRHQHGAAVVAPGPPPGRRPQPPRRIVVAGQRGGGPAERGAVRLGGRLGRAQRADPRPDEGVVGREGLADRGVGAVVGDPQRAGQHPPGLRRVQRPE